MKFAGPSGSVGGPERFDSIFGLVRDEAFVPGFKRDVSIRTTLPPGDLPTNTWSPINQQFAYRLSGKNRPGTVIKYHKPVEVPAKKPNMDKNEPARFNQTQQQRQWERRVRTEENESDLATEKFDQGTFVELEKFRNSYGTDGYKSECSPQQIAESYRKASAMLLSGQAAMRATRYNYNLNNSTSINRTMTAGKNASSAPQSREGKEEGEYLCGVSRHHRAQTPKSKEQVSQYEKDHGKALLLEFHNDQRSDLLKTKRVEILRREVSSGPSRTSNDTSVMKSIVFPDNSSMTRVASENSQLGMLQSQEIKSPHMESLHQELMRRKQQRESLQGQNAELQQRLTSLHKKEFPNANDFYDTAQKDIGRKSHALMKTPGVMSRNTLTSKEMYERQLATKKKMVY